MIESVYWKQAPMSDKSAYLTVSKTANKERHKRRKVRVHRLATLGNSAQSQNRHLPFLPIRRPQPILQQWQQDVEQVVSVDGREHVECGGGAFTEVPLGNTIIVVLVFLVLVDFVAIFVVRRHLLLLVSLGFDVFKLVGFGLMMTGLDVLIRVRNVGIVVGAADKVEDVVFSVDHALEENRNYAGGNKWDEMSVNKGGQPDLPPAVLNPPVHVRLKMVAQLVLLRKRQPKFAGFQRHTFVLILRAVQHKVDDSVERREQLVGPDFEQHHERLAHLLANRRRRVVGTCVQSLQKVVEVCHQGLGLAEDELVDTGNGSRADLEAGRVKECDDARNHVVERASSFVGVELLGRVFADLLEGAESSFDNTDVLVSEQLHETGHDLAPRQQTAARNDSRDDGSGSRSNKLFLVSNSLEDAGLDVLDHILGNSFPVDPQQVLEQEAGDGTNIRSLTGQLSKNVDEVATILRFRGEGGQLL